MKNDRQISYFIGGLVILIIAGILLSIFGKKQVSWSENYNPKEDSPYGTSALFSLMQQIRSNQPFKLIGDSVSTQLPTDPTDKIDTYLFIGNRLYADSADLEKLLDFVSNGNQVYLLCSDPDNLLFDSLLRAPKELYEAQFENEEIVITEDEEEAFYSEIPYDRKRVYLVSDTSITLQLNPEKFQASDYELKQYFNFEIIGRDWSYFKDNLTTFDQKPTTALGHFDEGYNNFIQFEYGKGKIYLHSSPLVFTNYYIRDITAMNYCRESLKDFGDGQIFWDEDNRNYDPGALAKNSPDYNPSLPSEGPLEFILSEPGLRNGWYLLLLTVALYLIFGARRQQRIIPFTEKMDNTSIEYAEVLSQMFMKQSDHRKLVLMKMDIFRSFVRERLGIRLPMNSEEEKETHIFEISQKSGVNASIIKEIFSMNQYHDAVSEVDTREMMLFHQKLEHFYLQCK